jgi:uncharacterized membrane protein
MSQVIQILVATCPDAATAKVKLKQIQNARVEQGADVMDAAVVERDAHNKLHIHETTDVSGGRGAAVGGILGGVLGLIAGPGGMVAGAAVGALVGGAAAHVFDTGIPHKRLAEIGSALGPGKAALVILTEAGFAPYLQTLIEGPDIEIAVESMNADAARQLGHDHDVALKALALGNSLADGGMASASESGPAR